MNTSRRSSPLSASEADLAAPLAEDQAAAMARLADTLGHASTGLFNYRCDHPDAPGAAQALALEKELDQRAVDLRRTAIVLLGAQAGEAVAQLRNSATHVDEFLAQVKTVEARMGLATAIITLAVAALSRDAGGVLSAAARVEAALKAASA